MPGVLPVLPGVELAGAYRGGGVAARSGGDWFDAFVTDAGLVAGVCGDVVGHGRAATAAMSELSTVLRMALLDGADVGAAAAAVERYAARSGATRGATAVVLLLDPATGVLEHVRPGHLPLLLRDARGAVRLLDGPGDAPLGLGGGAPRVHRTVLEPGEAVLACTTGALGPAARSVDDGLDALCRTVGGAADGGAAALCAAVAAGPAHERDAAVLAVSRRPADVTGLHLDVPADAGLLAEVRERVSDWLAALDVTAEGLTAVPLVVSELVSNAVEHAYPPGADGRVRLGVELDGRGGVLLAVADDGRWRPRPPGPVRTGGFGLAVVRDLATALQVVTGPQGTVVTAVCALHHPAQVVPPSSRPSAAPDPPEIVERTGVPPVVSVRGVLDSAAVDPLHAAVLRASEGGTRSVRLELGDVTLLTSAGVRVLHELAGLPARPEMHAPADARIARVLEIGGLRLSG
jgi:anti-sigma regulatory factor (Ser/Thr protein kinase)